jgi:hypothetical protein
MAHTTHTHPCTHARAHTHTHTHTYTCINIHSMHMEINSQYIVEKQSKRSERGRILRPLHCINTAWMGGVDWATLEAKALVCVCVFVCLCVCMCVCVCVCVCVHQDSACVHLFFCEICIFLNAGPSAARRCTHATPAHRRRVRRLNGRYVRRL